jgi:hypothetical protein
LENEYLIKHIEQQLKDESLPAEIKELLVQCKEHFEKPKSIINAENALKLIELLHAAMALGIHIHQHT